MQNKEISFAMLMLMQMQDEDEETRTIDKKKLITELQKISRTENDDYEITHYKADKLLLQYINDEEITEAYENVGKWYS